MADQLDKTIEELEAEVLGELEEANGADAPMKNAAKAEKQEAVPSDGVTGKADVGGAKPEAKVEKGADEDRGEKAIGKKAAAQSKEVSGDAQQKGEGKPDAMPVAKGDAKENKPLAAGDENVQGEEEIVEMTKMEMKDKMINAMASMNKEKMEKLMAMYNKMDEMDMDEAQKEKSEKVEKRVADIDVKEHVDALMNDENSELTDEFKKKAATVFEAAVKSKVREEVERLEEEYKNELTSEINETKEDLSEKVDNYLNYVVEEWMKENTLAIERGLKGEIAEDFISGLKQLFEDHYVDVPDEKYDVLEAQADKISKLEEKLEKTIQEVVESKKSNGSLIKEKVIKDVTSDLTDTEIEKFESLAQDVEYTEEGVYTEKLNTLKESYFPKQKVQTETHDEVETGTAVEDLNEDSSIAAYMSAIGRTVKSAK